MISNKRSPKTKNCLKGELFRWWSTQKQTFKRTEINKITTTYHSLSSILFLTMQSMISLEALGQLTARDLQMAPSIVYFLLFISNFHKQKQHKQQKQTQLNAIH